MTEEATEEVTKEVTKEVTEEVTKEVTEEVPAILPENDPFPGFTIQGAAYNAFGGIDVTTLDDDGTAVVHGLPQDPENTQYAKFIALGIEIAAYAAPAPTIAQLKGIRDEKMRKVINVLDQHRNELDDGGAVTRSDAQIAVWRTYRRDLLQTVVDVEEDVVAASAVVWPTEPTE